MPDNDHTAEVARLEVQLGVERKGHQVALDAHAGARAHELWLEARVKELEHLLKTTKRVHT